MTSYREMIEGGGLKIVYEEERSEDTKLRDVAPTWRPEAVTIVRLGEGQRDPSGQNDHLCCEVLHTSCPGQLEEQYHPYLKTSEKKEKLPAMAWFRGMLILFTLLLRSLPTEGKDPDFSTLLTNQAQIQKEIVNKHNELRRSVNPSASNMLKMEWSIEATGNAQRWANQCNLEHSNSEDRKINTRCGENLYMSSDPTSWSRVIQNWYDESEHFIYGVGAKPNSAVGHYTQVVWYSSYKIGCGVAFCPGQTILKYFYVCHYCPAGNNAMKKGSPYQQGNPCASCPNNCDNGLCTNSCVYEDFLSNCESLKSTAGCEHDLLKEKCQATCLCEDKIH